MKSAHLPDEQLIDLLRADDKSAFDELYHRFHKRLVITAMGKLHSQDLAEEVVQELFVSLWLKRTSLVIQESVAAYLGMAVRYMVIKYFQKEQSRKKYLAHLAISDYASNETENIVYSNELQQVIQSEIDKLPVKCREVFCLSRVENLSHKEIASRLQISEKTVENQMTKALRVLRLSLKNVLPSVLLSILLH